MRRGFGLVIGLVLTIVLLMVVGAVAYNVGWSAAANMHAAPGAAGPGPFYYGYGFHPFFAGFGILWFLLILFGIFWLLRFAFFGRMWGRGWGYRHWGYGPGPGGTPAGPGGFPSGMEERMQEWHRRAHGEQPPAGSTPPPPPPPPDTRSV